MAFARRSGILLHPTSLPGAYGVGELGREATAWLDFLASAGQRLWQVMPLGPTGYGDSPYQSFSTFAGNHFLISMETLVEEGWLQAAELASLAELPAERVDYGALIPRKLELLEAAAERFGRAASAATLAQLEAFKHEHAGWLDDYTLFMALKEAHGGSAWSEWVPGLRDREPAALARARAEVAAHVAKHTLWQFWFFTQWNAVRARARELGVEIIGDVPIFVSMDSADAWANPELFHFAEGGVPTVVAGVPPDYFSVTGQRWGNPLYRWDRLAETDYAWWVERVRATLKMVDIVRIDHFRGFAAYWQIPASEPTAVNGRWVPGPGDELFAALRRELGELPLIAEDLGVITPDVDELRRSNGFPGMKVLQFAFASDADDPYLPHNYTNECVVYTGTHDNDTTAGWYAAAPEVERDLVRRYLARDDGEIAWELIRLAQASVADTAIVPLQDALGLGSDARMNTPGTAGGNWSWRFAWQDVPYWIAPQLAELAELYGRLPGTGAKDTAYRQSVLDD
ncbi:MAG: 4-alpha-glucanotransferase [Trueperaceae bacterium]